MIPRGRQLFRNLLKWSPCAVFWSRWKPLTVHLVLSPVVGANGLEDAQPNAGSRRRYQCPNLRGLQQGFVEVQRRGRAATAPGGLNTVRRRVVVFFVGVGDVGRQVAWPCCSSNPEGLTQTSEGGTCHCQGPQRPGTSASKGVGKAHHAPGLGDLLERMWAQTSRLGSTRSTRPSTAPPDCVCVHTSGLLTRVLLKTSRSLACSQRIGQVAENAVNPGGCFAHPAGGRRCVRLRGAGRWFGRQARSRNR